MKLANYPEESWHLYNVQFPSKTTEGMELHLFIYLFFSEKICGCLLISFSHFLLRLVIDVL